MSTRQQAVEYSRNFALEDIAIQPGGDGRVVTAYAAVFDVPTRITDQDGTYEEIIDRSAFNKAVNDARPSGNRQSWRCGVFFNHARTLYGTPSEMHSVPIGVCLDIKPDLRGLLTVTRYLPAADNILEAIREGAITAYSFQGAFLRSSPATASPSGGKFKPGPDGRLRTVRRLVSTLREFGPTPAPAYESAEILGVRAADARQEQRRVLAAFRAKAIVEGIDLAAEAKRIVAGRGGYDRSATGHAEFSARTRQVCRELGIDLESVRTR